MRSMPVCDESGDGCIKKQLTALPTGPKYSSFLQLARKTFKQIITYSVHPEV